MVLDVSLYKDFYFTISLTLKLYNSRVTSILKFDILNLKINFIVVIQ